MHRDEPIGATAPRPAIEIGPAPDPDPTRRWVATAVGAVLGLVVLARLARRRR